MKTAETITFRPADLREPLEVAVDRLGVPASEIIRNCVRESLVLVVTRMIKRVTQEKPALTRAVEDALKMARNN